MNPIDEKSIRLFDAIAFAARAHQGQLRKDGRTPYASHPFRVCMIVRDAFGFDDHDILLAAVLHDTIEDTTTDFDDLAERYGSNVAQWVAALSKDKRLPEDQREQAYLEKLQQAPWQVHVCKLADIVDNMLDTAHLDPDRRARAKRRVEFYYRGIQQVAKPELAQALEIAGEVIQRVR